MREMKKKKNRDEREEDRDRDFFGELPIELIHTILSFLISPSPCPCPSKLDTRTKKQVEVAQTIILSKKFRQAWYTFPDLYFSDFLTFSKILFLQTSRPVVNPYQFQQFSNNAKERFANYILHTVAKYQRHDYMTRRSHLIAGVQDEKIANILNQCSIAHRKAKENGVKTMVRIRPHNLLQTFFSLVQLVSLDLYWSHLVKNDVEDCDIFMINCPFVRRLNVGSIIIHEAVLEKLFHSCPLIEEIKLASCEGIETIKIHNLPNLRMLDITTTKNQTVYVNAESLELMTYRQVSFPNVLVIESAPNLKILKLLCADITDAHFHNLIANCPILEELTLQNCDEIHKIKVSSHSLSFLSILCCRHLMEVKIDAPNLNMFEYYGNRVLSPLSFANGSYGKSKSCVTLYWDDDGPEEVPSFLELSEFLTTFKHTDNISLKFISAEISFDRNIVDDLRDENNKPEFEEVYVEVSSPSSTYSAVMEGMLWSFSPKIISVKRDSKEDDEFIMYLCEQLLVQHGDHLNISTGASNCWRNYFKQAKLSERDDEWRPLHSWNSLAHVLENLGDHYTLKLSHD